MNGHPGKPPGLSAEETADRQECQSDHDDLMAQLAHREALIENGLIDSYEEYAFVWGRQAGPPNGSSRESQGQGSSPLG